LLRAARLRYQLLPYVYSLAWRSTHEGYTMMRGLAMDFPDQPALRRLDDTYMFGPAFLVQPITRPMFHAELPRAPTVPKLRTPDGQPGLALEYFDGVNFDRPVSRTVDAVVDHRWPGPPLANPPPGLDRLERFSARWQGELVAAESGEHEIGVEGDDGFRVWLDDKLVVEDWKESGARFAGARVVLRKGQAVRVRIDYFQKGGGRVMRLAWRTPSERSALAERQRRLDLRQATLLPEGTDWYDFWTGQRHAGGASTTRRYAIDEFPLFVRAGSIVPLGPVIQYAGEKPDAPYEIRIYPGADGRFTLYDDDGETYRYEKGEYATAALAWDEARHTLRIGAREGGFPGMTGQRTLKVRLMPARFGGRVQTKTVRFRGEPIELHFTP
ncbi:MAG TPA: DUF5110 domain-containing protein, partial [Lysobacter sp.]|nr:DUF5110 domain-containing protein [Lysobacter sp.]